VLMRRERRGERYGVHGVHRAAFGRVVEADLVDALRRGKSWVQELSFVAFVGGDLAGHVVASRAWVDGVPVLGLGPLGVLPRFQGGGVGTALMHTVLGAADALGEPLVGLLGDPGFYGRFGFRSAVDYAVLPAEAAWGRHFQVRELAGYDPGIRGGFEYAQEFSAVS
jgi:putative acetyltransferase